MIHFTHLIKIMENTKLEPLPWYYWELLFTINVYPRKHTKHNEIGTIRLGPNPIVLNSPFAFVKKMESSLKVLRIVSPFPILLKFLLITKDMFQ